MKQPSSEQQDSAPKNRMVGLQAHAAVQRQETVDRLQRIIQSLEAQKKPVSAQTIFAEGGLAYNSYGRNKEACALFQKHSTALKAKRKQKRSAGKEATTTPRDPLLSSSKAKLVTRLRQEMERRRTMEVQYARLVEEVVRRDTRIMQLEAQVVKLSQPDQ